MDVLGLLEKPVDAFHRIMGVLVPTTATGDLAFSLGWRSVPRLALALVVFAVGFILLAAATIVFFGGMLALSLWIASYS